MKKTALIVASIIALPVITAGCASNRQPVVTAPTSDVPKIGGAGGGGF